MLLSFAIALCGTDKQHKGNAYRLSNQAKFQLTLPIQFHFLQINLVTIIFHGLNKPLVWVLNRYLQHKRSVAAWFLSFHLHAWSASYALKISPAEHFINWQQDAFGNYLARLVFPEKCTEFEVDVEVIAADSLMANPDRLQAAQQRIAALTT